MRDARAFYTSFNEIFPPPRFLEMPSVGLDMSDQTIRFVELRRYHFGFRLGVYGEEKIPTDVVEEGYIKDKPKLTEILSALKKKYRLRFIKASLPEEKSYLFKTRIPLMSSSDMRASLRFKIEENVPVPLDKAVFDYRIITPPKPGDSTVLVSVTVMHAKAVSSYLGVFKGAGLVPLSFQVESQAIAHAALANDVNETYILVAVRGRRTVLSIVSQGEVQFTSTLHVGGDSIAESMKKNLNILGPEVEKIRQGKEERESNEMFLSLVSAATALRDEVQKLITYWINHSEEHGYNQNIAGIIISGADAMLGLDDYLARSLDLKVTIANPWLNILKIEDFVPALTLREALDYMPALGLALPYD